jgi:hypothetical protein
VVVSEIRRRLLGMRCSLLRPLPWGIALLGIVLLRFPAVVVAHIINGGSRMSLYSIIHMQNGQKLINIFLCLRLGGGSLRASLLHS